LGGYVAARVRGSAGRCAGAAGPAARADAGAAPRGLRRRGARRSRAAGGGGVGPPGRAAPAPRGCGRDRVGRGGRAARVRGRGRRDPRAHRRPVDAARHRPRHPLRRARGRSPPARPPACRARSPPRLTGAAYSLPVGLGGALLLGTLVPLGFFGLLILLVVAVTNRGEADPGGRRPYAAYLF